MGSNLEEKLEMPAYFDAQADLVSYLNQLGPQCRPAELLDVLRRTRLLLESKGFKKCLPDTLSVLRLVYA